MTWHDDRIELSLIKNNESSQLMPMPMGGGSIWAAQHGLKARPESMFKEPAELLIHTSLPHVLVLLSHSIEWCGLSFIHGCIGIVGVGLPHCSLCSAVQVTLRAFYCLTYLACPVLSVEKGTCGVETSCQFGTAYHILYMLTNLPLLARIKIIKNIK